MVDRPRVNLGVKDAENYQTEMTTFLKYLGYFKSGMNLPTGPNAPLCGMLALNHLSSMYSLIITPRKEDGGFQLLLRNLRQRILKFEATTKNPIGSSFAGMRRYIVLVDEVEKLFDEFQRMKKEVGYI